MSGLKRVVIALSGFFAAKYEATDKQLPSDEEIKEAVRLSLLLIGNDLKPEALKELKKYLEQ